MNENETIIVAAFKDEAAAAAAIQSLLEWDKRVRDVKLGTIGTVRRQAGKIKSEVAHSSFLKRGMPISADASRILAQVLTEDHIAVVVACDDFEATMVSDNLVRSGGQILASTYELTPQERAEEQKNIEDALAVQDMEEAAEKAKRPTSHNINRAL